MPDQGFDIGAFDAGAFDDAAWQLDTVVTPPPSGVRRGLGHFAARHFSGLRYFWSLTLAGYSVDVIVEPPKPPLADFGYADLEYKITIVVRRKDKTWTQSRYVSYFTGKSLEKVVAVFKKGTTILDRVRLKAKLLNTTISQILIKVKVK